MSIQAFPKPRQIASHTLLHKIFTVYLPLNGVLFLLLLDACNAASLPCSSSSFSNSSLSLTVKECNDERLVLRVPTLTLLEMTYLVSLIHLPYRLYPHTAILLILCADKTTSPSGWTRGAGVVRRSRTFAPKYQHPLFTDLICESFLSHFLFRNSTLLCTL